MREGRGDVDLAELARRELGLAAEEQGLQVRDEALRTLESRAAEQEADLAVSRAWAQRVFAAGFGWITGPTRYGGRGLPVEYQRIWAGAASDYRTPSLSIYGIGLGMVAPTQPYQWPGRKIDATHPDIYLDHDRCILCSRCIRASRMEDGKTVFGFEGRGIAMRLNIDAEGGLGETQMAAIDKAASVCPVACIVIKRDAYRVPNGSRRFDTAPIGSDIEAKRKQGIS